LATLEELDPLGHRGREPDHDRSRNQGVTDVDPGETRDVQQKPGVAQGQSVACADVEIQLGPEARAVRELLKLPVDGLAVARETHLVARGGENLGRDGDPRGPDLMRRLDLIDRGIEKIPGGWSSRISRIRLS
jgi:hypothetical protein